MSEAVKQELKLLREFGVITSKDRRYGKVKKILESKENETSAHNWARDIILGTRTLDEAIAAG